ncbi:MAG: hypothetical protein LQ340_007408 [Diploschistes diacapsis]|nr:MAG: hypothetical protein LQ340_007408 [Diploschistes diacapsis]
MKARRSVVGNSGVDFARQLREANAPPQKKFRSTTAPKGTKLASGYVDRAQLRESTGEDEKATRVKSLEEMVKLGQMEQSTFEKLRDEIVGGDVENVHLVKGLDRRLLERARKGEDVFKKPEAKRPAKSEGRDEEKVEIEDVEAALDELEGHDVVPVARQKKKEDTPPTPVAGKKRTRDDILQELKAARLKARAEVVPTLGSKFRKLGAQLQPGTSRIEKDGKGREVLITVDEDGNVKRKVRKARPAAASALKPGQKNGLLMPDKDAIPLGADTPIIPQKHEPAQEPSDDEDIFEGVGAKYDPLGGSEGSDSDSSSTESGEEPEKPPNKKQSVQRSVSPPSAANDAAKSMPPPSLPSKPRNYFNEKPSAKTEDHPSNPFQDPSFLAGLQRMSTLAQKTVHAYDDEDNDGNQEEDVEVRARKLARRKAMLQPHDRDAEDMDLGFGSSRFEDQEDGEDRKVKLSRWEGDGEGDEEGGKGRSGQGQRKRGKKKKKGDKNSASDVLAVLDRRGRG